MAVANVMRGFRDQIVASACRVFMETNATFHAIRMRLVEGKADAREMESVNVKKVLQVLIAKCAYTEPTCLEMHVTRFAPVTAPVTTRAYAKETERADAMRTSLNQVVIAAKSLGLDSNVTIFATRMKPAMAMVCAEEMERASARIRLLGSTVNFV